MKKLISIIILISIAAVSAQAKFGMQMRLRSEMQNLNSTDADKQVYDRQVDVRLRPDISYTVNDYLSVKAVFEIGDIQYGSEGGARDTDGKNLETKNIFIDIKPTKNHTFRLGLMPYKDAHSMIVDTDLAGILWMGQFEKYNVEFGWFAANDKDEEYMSQETYSFGTSLIGLNQMFTMNKYIKLGVSNLFVMNREEYLPGVNRDYVSVFTAPRIVLDFGKFNFDAQFIHNNNFADYDEVEDNPLYTDQPHDPDRTGLGLSVKSKFEMDSKTTFRANILFRGCYENWENYEAYKSFYDTGLEILNEDANGITFHNPMNTFTSSNGHQLGIVVPSVFVDWKYKENIVFTGGFGFVMNDQSYDKRTIWGSNNAYEALDNVVNDDMFLAWELDFKAKVTLYDNIAFLPYIAFLVPTDNFAYNTIYNPDTDTYDRDTNFIDDNDPDTINEPATDMQMKIGATVKYNF
ncbi:TPA: hypothetical protein DCR49_06125 [Candidatus Delongbacteria bacterium]|nr:hypothetical protein [Candidatus Delongbacteria bacterium]